MCDLNKQRKELTAQKNAEKSLKQSISDLDKVIGDFEMEQRRLVTKQSNLLTQTLDLEAELSDRGLIRTDQA